MKKLFQLFSILTLLCFICSSCGVMFGGSKFNGAVIAKDHPYADIYVDGNNIGKGTGTILYPRNKSLTIELRQEGCESNSQTFHNTFRTGNFLLSAVMWGLLGIAVDLGTGAAYKPDHKNTAVEKVNDDAFTFVVDYPECPTEIVKAKNE